MSQSKLSRESEFVFDADIEVDKTATESIDYCSAGAVGWKELRSILLERHIQSQRELEGRRVLFCSLSKEAREILGVIIKTPSELMEVFKANSGDKSIRASHKTLRAILVDYLRFNGWSYPNIRKALKELKEYTRKICLF